MKFVALISTVVLSTLVQKTAAWGFLGHETIGYVSPVAVQHAYTDLISGLSLSP